MVEQLSFRSKAAGRRKETDRGAARGAKTALALLWAVAPAAVLRGVARAGALAAFASGCGALLLAALGIRVPGALLPPPEALLYLLAGASLWLVRGRQTAPWSRRLGLVCGTAVAAAGILLLALSRGWDHPALLQWLPRSAVPEPVVPATAYCFLGIGAALALLHGRSRRSAGMAVWIAVAPGTVSLTALVGHLYQVPLLRGAAAAPEMPLAAAALLLLLSAGITCAPQETGPARILASPTAGGAMARRMLPAAAAGMLCLGGALVGGSRIFALDGALAVSLFALAGTLGAGFVILWSARSLEWTDTEPRRARQELELLTATLERRVADRTQELHQANRELEAEIAERKRAQAAQQQANENLRSWVNELKVRTREITLLNELGDLLQASHTNEEACEVIARISQQLFPTASGILYLAGESQDLLEPVGAWTALEPGEPGSPPSPGREFARGECWALRRGRLHAVEDAARGTRCRHIDTPLPGAYACVPLTAQGEAIGVLYLGLPVEGSLPEARQQLAVAVAEHIALSLSNLKLREKLRIQSIRDPLTSLYNRRHMEESLERELHRARRSRRTLAIVAVDVDHFKRLNDTFGHDAGDAVLREVGKLLQTHTRGEDIACRFGGEEFVLILPDASLSNARERAEQLRAAAQKLDLRHAGESLGPVTLSLGVAAYPEHGETVSQLLKSADAALYQAKREGRDRVRAAGDPVSE